MEGHGKPPSTAINCLFCPSAPEDPKALPTASYTLLEARDTCRKGKAHRREKRGTSQTLELLQAISGKYLHPKSSYDPPDENQGMNPF